MVKNLSTVTIVVQQRSILTYPIDQMVLDEDKRSTVIPR